LSFLIFLLAFAFYLHGLSGTIPTYRDSGDLIASIYTLGIAHPPGYAFYVIVGKLFTLLLPFGNIAYRINVLSALFAAGMAAVLYRLLLLACSRCPMPRRESIGVSAIVTVLLATSPAVIALARVAEMYTLAAFLSAAILYCLLSDDPRGISCAALLLGLGLSVHPTLIFLTPLFVSAYRREGVSAMKNDVTPSRRHALTPILFFLLGLSVFLYLPIRASQHPLVNWGDPSTWRNFWRVVTRADYGGLKLHPEQSSFSWTPASALAQVRYFATAMKAEWGWGALFLGSLGVLLGLRSAAWRFWTGGLLISWILSGPAFFLLSNLPLAESTTPAILQPYLLLCGVLWVPLVVLGFYGVCSWTSKPFLMALLSMALMVGSRPWSWTSQRNDFYAYDYARNLLRALPPGAVLYEPDDPTHFSLRVLQLVEGRRPDVILLNFFRTRWGYEEIKRQWPDLLPPIPIESGQELRRILWTYSAKRHPFYAELPQKLIPVSYRSQGLVYAAQMESTTASRIESEARLVMNVQRGDFVTTHHSDFFTAHVISYYAAAQNNLGIEYANVEDWPHAVSHYREALQIEPEQSAAQRNLAFALQKMPKHL